MKKILLSITLSALLTGCMTLPSFWDDNQSSKAVTVWHDIKQINCDSDYRWQVVKLNDDLNWFILYSKAKGTDDVLAIAETMSGTVAPFAAKQDISTAYCNVKKKLLDKQGEALSKAVLGRY